VKVLLNDRQIEMARELAKKRHEAKDGSFRNSGILTDIKKKTLVEEYIYDRSHKPHFLGLLGEIAYAAMVGKKIDTKIYSIRDSGFDVGNAEIKTATRIGNDIELKIKQKEFHTKRPDNYVLVRVNEHYFTRVELIGQISREDFDKYKTTKQYGPNNPINYVVGMSRLQLFPNEKILL
jgi:hypothetical protein